MRRFILGLVSLLVLSVAGPAVCRCAELSREMVKAINFYKVGNTHAAMDAFLDVITHSPSPDERALANTYLNKISLDLGKPDSADPMTLLPEEQNSSAVEEAFRLKPGEQKGGKYSTPIGLTPSKSEREALIKAGNRQVQQKQAGAAVQAGGKPGEAVQGTTPAPSRPGKPKDKILSAEEAAALSNIPSSIQVASPAPDAARGKVDSVTLIPGLDPIRTRTEEPAEQAPPSPTVLGLATDVSSAAFPDADIQAHVDAEARSKAEAAAVAAALAGDKTMEMDVSGAEQPSKASISPEDAAERAKWLEQVTKKVGVMRQRALSELQKTSGVTISTLDNGMPEAIGLAPDAIFMPNSVQFKPGAAGTLLRVASLLFTVGKANLMLLPEGSLTGNLGMLDMRRTMAINSWLAHRGISPARLKANLTAVINKNFPEAFKNISGIGIVFDYEKEKELVQPSPDQTTPPVLSLGIYPAEIDVSKGEGALVEISAVETAAQIASWELQMLTSEGGKTISVVKSISGTGPIYTQTYWNGRSGGQVVPSGQYACILTATDVLGARISIKTFLTITGTPARLSSSAGPGGAAKSQSKAGAKKPPSTALNRQYKEYYISFVSGSSALPKSSKAAMKKVVEGIKTVPLSRVVVTGLASSEETEASAAKLALRRARNVAAVLMKDYGISEDRVVVKNKVSDNAKPAVKVALVGEGENI